MPSRAAERRSRIVVAAGTNGAGKSAIIGEYLAATGGAYFNPDLFARRLVEAGTPPAAANAAAWKAGFNGLRRAIDQQDDFTFETTLGGTSIVQELHRAIAKRCKLRVWYVGLSSPELHIQRVQARVRRGGHDIPEARIRERYSRSLANLVSLIGKAAEIHVFDNSEETLTGLPAPRLVFRMSGKRIVEPDMQTLMQRTPEWAKPAVAAALRSNLLARNRGRGRRKK